MNRTLYVFLAVMVMAAVTYLIRLFPFLVFGRAEKPPDFILYIGRVISPAAIAMLVVYCLKNVDFASGAHGLPEFVSIAATVALHLWKRRMLLSILGGTLCYMALVQLVF